MEKEKLKGLVTQKLDGVYQEIVDAVMEPKQSMYFQALERREINKKYKKQEWFCYLMFLTGLFLLTKGAMEL